jgi:glycosyltransferase involved in cell wall biosynthesis
VTVEIVPHASYVGVYPAGRTREEVRADLGIPSDAFAFLCFGELRAYKDLETVLRGFGEASLPHAMLVVAGGVTDERTAARVTTVAAADPRVVALLDFVAFDRVGELFAACDAAILARADGGTSGSLLLALSLDRPVVVPSLPAYREIVSGTAGWYFEPHDAASLRRALETAASDPEDAREKGAAGRRIAARLTWPDAAASTAWLMTRAHAARARSGRLRDAWRRVQATEARRPTCGNG